MYNCPACGKPTFSFWQRISLGPGRCIHCSACDAAVSVPWIASSVWQLAMAFAMPFGMVFGMDYLLPLLPRDVFGMWALSGSLGALVLSAMLLWMYCRYVPLVKKG